jgi:hypothetical protein
MSIAKADNFQLPRQMSQSIFPIVFEPSVTSQGDKVTMMGRVAGAAIGFGPTTVTVKSSAESKSQLAIHFDGARETTPSGLELKASTTNYLIGNDPTKWRAQVPNYSKVLYSQLYPGIDAVFYGSGSQLEHDFIVSPGADYRQIRISFSEGTRISLAGDGTLHIQLAEFTVQMKKPVIYQEIGGQRRMRNGSFTVSAKGVVGLRVHGYDPRQRLIIDPVLSFATYISALGQVANKIAIDADGNNYVAGTGGLGFPVTSGAFSGCSTCSDNNVVTFVSKLSPDGSSLIYSTVLGGSDFAQATGIVVDGNGNAIVTGWTGAADFPTKNGRPVVTAMGTTMGFLVSLSADGSELNYGTLLGANPPTTSNTYTYLSALALDSAGNAYVTGETGEGFFTTPGALNQGGAPGEIFGQFNVFLAKFSPTGSLIYSSILGAADPQNPGGGPPGSSAIAVDDAGNAYVSGQAGSLWPVSSNAYLKQVPGPMPYYTPFVTKVAPDAKSLLYSTYLDYAYIVTGIAALPNGNVFVTGNNAGAAFPTSPDAFQQNSATGNDSFLIELNSNGSNLVYSTMVSSGSYWVYGMALDPNNHDIWLAASTSNQEFPLVDPLQSLLPYANGFSETTSVLNQFDPAGHTLKFSSFLGGNAVGYATDLKIDAGHRAHVAGAATYGMYTTTGVYAESVPNPGQGFSLAGYPYIAVVDPTVPAGAICVNHNTGLNFFSTPAGAFAELPLVISNCGTAPLTIASASAQGAFSVPVQTACKPALAPGGKCTLAVRYSPPAVANDYSLLTIQSNPPLQPAVLALSGVGVDSSAPFMVLSPPTLSFASQSVGTISTPQPVTLTNSGRSALPVTSISFVGNDTGSFAKTSSCGSSVAAGQSCTVQVSFAPVAAGAARTALAASDDPDHITQFVNLTGAGVVSPFTITPPSAGASSTVTAGQPANYALSISPSAGYSGNLVLTCSNLPKNASCSFAPSSISISDGKPANFTVTVATEATQVSTLMRDLSLGSLLMAFLWMVPSKRKYRRSTMTGLLLLVTLAGFSACGGGGAPSVPPPAHVTVVPGTYTVQLNATDGNTTQVQPLTLVVK